MELAQTQALLARLYTDNGFRDRFLKDPESAAAESGITAEEARQLARQCSDQVQGFARSLKAKRLSEVLPLLPGTADALGLERFRELFLVHASDFVPIGINKPRKDALSFAAWLEKHPSEAGKALQIARYERCILETYDQSPRLTFRIFRLPENSADPNSSPRPMLGIWLRLHRQAPLLHSLLRVPRWRRSLTSF